MIVELTQDLGYIRKGTQFTKIGERWYYPVKSLDIDANVCLTSEYVESRKNMFRKVNDTSKTTRQ